MKHDEYEKAVKRKDEQIERLEQEREMFINTLIEKEKKICELKAEINKRK